MGFYPEWLGSDEAGRMTLNQYRYRQHKKKGLKKRLPRVLTIKQVKLMLKNADKVYPPTNKIGYKIYMGKPEIRNSVILYILFYTGVRNDELRTLKIEDIDFTDGYLKVLGKGKKERNIPMPKFVGEKIREFIGERQEGYVFMGYSEMGLISKQQIARLIKEIARVSNIRNYKEIHTHTLRHSYATHLRNKGYALDELKVLLGHTNISTTNIYAHLGTKDLFKKVLNTFESE